MRVPTWVFPVNHFGSFSAFMFRGVAQLVARTAGGREVAGSSPVTPTILRFKDQSAHYTCRDLGFAQDLLPLNHTHFIL